MVISLKGPKREIFVAGIFAHIRRIWIGDLGTRPKNPKKYVLALQATALKKKKKLKFGARSKKSCFRPLLYSLVWP